MSQEGMRVLVVDDDATLREAMRLTLEDAGYVVTEAGDGQAGMDALRASAGPTIVLLNRRMGQSGSEEFLQQVMDAGETLRRHAYLEVTTSAQRPTLALQHLLVGLSVSVIFKPVDDAALLDAIHRAGDRLSASWCDGLRPGA